MTDESSQSGSGSESEWEEIVGADVEQARIRDPVEELRSSLCLSILGFPHGTDDQLLCIFTRFCPMASHRKRGNGLELQFSSADNLERGILMAKRLVVGKMQIRWHVGRLEDDPTIQPPPPRGPNQTGGFGVFSKLRRAFANYFS
ncbi:uncharacterized protein LOC108103818 [Drosophila eugracilis]|uniref:uncharacterized protein LOC108103818 n=1 Tax=Drosophila eugracilis TaxID=29029 RepID=UPI0007E6BC04|nr:uncharacterized protein LOC108103818 [Drosophila eugracilis]